MRKSEALKLRRLIEKAAKSLGDDDAIEAPFLFPSWVAGKDYTEGERCCHNGLLYRCLTAHISQGDWEPSEAPSLFVRVSDPTIEFPEWVQPAGSHDAYGKGDKVSHNGKLWISKAEANVYEPGVYGWEEVSDV